MDDKNYAIALERFHYMVGTYISTRINAEYALGLSEMYDLSVKGEKSKQSAVLIHENRACIFADMLGKDLKSKGIQLDIAEQQVDRIEEVIHACLYLEEGDCHRVMNLIKKLRVEKKHIYTLNPDEPTREHSEQMAEA